MGYRGENSCICEPGQAGQLPGLAGPVQWLLNTLSEWAKNEQLGSPVVISTCRSAGKQAEMRARYDRGDRTGLAYRPADPKNSRHVPDETGVCWAFDLGNSDQWLRQAGAFVQTRAVTVAVPGARWGGVWLPPDINHFEIIGMRTAASIRLT